MSGYDVIVVGARCAGGATAMLLARQGLRVLVLDRSRRGSDKLSTLYIHQPGVARLRAWGLLPAVEATGAPPIRTLTYRAADVLLTAPGPWVDGGDAAYAPRRSDLDEILCSGAEAAGAVVQHEASVHELLRDDGRVCGVRYRHRGRGVDVHAPLVVGADGMRSVVAELAGAAAYISHPRLSCCYYGFWSGIDTGFQQHEVDGHWVGVIPTRDDQRLIACYFRQSEFSRVRSDAETAYRDCLELAAPSVAERTRTAERAGRLIGMGDQQNYFRRSAGPGWVLVGDAGHHKDSLTARGITDAFTQADLLGAALLRAGTTAGPQLDGELRRYGQERDDALMPYYHATLGVARLALQPERLQLLRDTAACADRSALYAAAAAGVLTPADYQEQIRNQEQTRNHLQGATP